MRENLPFPAKSPLTGKGRTPDRDEEGGEDSEQGVKPCCLQGLPPWQTIRILRRAHENTCARATWKNRDSPGWGPVPGF